MKRISFLKPTSVATVAMLSAVSMFVGWTTGCGGANNNRGGNLASSESALVNDQTDTDEVDDSLETGVEEPLSGSISTDPGAVDPITIEADLSIKLSVNPAAWFTPPGCLKTTVTDMSVTAVFTNCKGPFGLHTYNGTVKSQWSIGSGKLTVTHEAEGFQVDGATVDHHATIEYTKTGSFYTRQRNGMTTGTTKKGTPFEHSFDYTATWDSAKKCITRDGTASASLGDRSYSASITDYERCGVGAWGCPLSGTITLKRESPDPQLTLSLDFPGGAKVEVTRPNGTTVDWPLLCLP